MSLGKKNTGVFNAIDKSRRQLIDSLSPNEEIEKIIKTLDLKAQDTAIKALRDLLKNPSQKLMHGHYLHGVHKSCEKDPYAFKRIVLKSNGIVSPEYPATLLAYKAEIFAWNKDETLIEIAKKTLAYAIKWQKQHILFLENSLNQSSAKQDIAWRFYDLPLVDSDSKSEKLIIIEWAKDELAIYESWLCTLDKDGQLRTRAYDRYTQNGIPDLSRIINNKIARFIMIGDMEKAIALDTAESLHEEMASAQSLKPIALDLKIAQRVILVSKYLHSLDTTGKKWFAPSIQNCNEKELFVLSKAAASSHDPAILDRLGREVYLRPELMRVIPVAKGIEDIYRNIKALNRAPDYYGELKTNKEREYSYNRTVYTITATPKAIVEFLNKHPQSELAISVEPPVAIANNPSIVGDDEYMFTMSAVLSCEDINKDKYIIQLATTPLESVDSETEALAAKKVMNTDELKELWSKACDPNDLQAFKAYADVKWQRREMDLCLPYSHFANFINKNEWARISFEPKQVKLIDNLTELVGVDNCKHQNTIWYPQFDEATLRRATNSFAIAPAWQKCCKDCLQPRLDTRFIHELPIPIKSIAFECYENKVKDETYLSLVNKTRLAQGLIDKPYKDFAELRSAEPVIELEDDQMPSIEDMAANRPFFNC